jgi:hypothetical protein
MEQVLVVEAEEEFEYVEYIGILYQISSLLSEIQEVE